ncbi:MAG: amino acid ABC transporter permease [Clostridiales bacterium]|nr:amino acid ABC transporter permease [Clostridiales bacterium]
MNSFEIFYREFITKGGYKTALEGLLVTIEIAVLGLIIGIVLGTLIALVKIMPKYKRLPRILEKVCDVYVGFFRGTPMVVQLLLGYFVLLPALGISVDGVMVAIIIFGLNSGAYVSEIMRAGIQSVDVGQLEAGRALGLTYWSAMLKVVIPQSVKNILPTLGNEFIVLIKETSVVSFIAVVDVTKAFKAIGDATYEYLVPYIALALVYLVLVLLITWGLRVIERRFKKNERNS